MGLKFITHVILRIVIPVAALACAALLVQDLRIASADIVSADGHAWSSHIGWVSFKGNATNGSPYQVRLDTVTGNLSGYAWSSTLGWLSFNRSDTCDPLFDDPGTEGVPYDPSDPSTQCDGSGPIARRNAATNEVIGWARFCSVFAAGCSGALKPEDVLGGWDGWVKFKGVAGDGTNYGGKYDAVTGNVTGYAWGSDVVGWLSLSSRNCDPTGDGIVDGPPTGPNLKGFWKLENTGAAADDSSGNNNHGVLAPAGSGPWRASTWDCKDGECLWFDGVDDSVEIPNRPTLNPSQELTATLWVKPWWGFGSPGNPGLISKRDVVNGSDIGWGGLWVRQTDGALWGRIYEADGTAINLPTRVLTPDQWAHVAVVADRTGAGTGFVRFYVDGNQVGSDLPYDGTIKTNNEPLRIGRHINEFFSGLIDEVRFYDRALTQQEVRDVMNAGVFASCPAAGTPIPRYGVVLSNTPVTLDVTVSAVPQSGELTGSPAQFTSRITGTRNETFGTAGFTYDCGDGVPHGPFFAGVGVASNSYVCTYRSPGTFTARVTVRTPASGPAFITGTATTPVTVTIPPATMNVNLTANPVQGTLAGTPRVFRSTLRAAPSVVSTLMPPAHHIDYTFECGNGTGMTYNDVATTIPGGFKEHVCVYTTAGTVTARVRIHHDELTAREGRDVNAQDTVSITILPGGVQECPPGVPAC